MADSSIDSKTAVLDAVEKRDDLDLEAKRESGETSDSSSDSDEESVAEEKRPLKIVARRRPTAEKNVEDELNTPLKTSRYYMNVGGNFFTGIDISSEDAMRRREERVKRFGTQEEPTPLASYKQDGAQVELDVTKLEARSKRFGTKLLLAEGQPVKLVKSLPLVPAGRVRPEAVHLHGTDEMSTGDILEFFSLYCPRNVEWINDQSCNAVWEDEVSAQRALAGLGRRPLALMSDEEVEAAAQEPAESQGETEQKLLGQERELEGESSMELKESDDTRKEDENKGERKQEEEEGETSSVQWWLAPPHARAKKLLLRQATTGDQKKQGAARRSQYYMKYGNPNEPLKKEPLDLRGRLGRKRPAVELDEALEGEGDCEELEQMEVEALPDDPLAFLVKRPKPMHADRNEEEEYEEDECGKSGENRERGAELGRLGEEEGGEVGAGGSEATDLRKLLKKKRKRRDLQLRLGHYPRIVEEHR